MKDCCSLLCIPACTSAGSGRHWKPLFAGPKKHSEQEAGEKEIWPMLFKKALAKLYGSYECTDAGMSEDALQLLTGGVISYLSLTGAASEFDTLRTALREDSPDDTFVCCGCRPSREGFTSAALKAVGLFSGHAYSLTRAVVTRRGVRLVQVHNPWGRCEWNGAYSDKSAEMTPELKTELNSDVEEVRPNLKISNRFSLSLQRVDDCLTAPTPFNVLGSDSPSPPTRTRDSRADPRGRTAPSTWSSGTSAGTLGGARSWT